MSDAARLTAAPPFGICVTWTDAGPVTRVQGEVDIATALHLRAVVHALIDEGEHELVLDLDDVQFMDASGIGVLAGAAGRLRRLGGHLTMRAVPPRTARILDLTRMSAVIRSEDAASGATTADSGRGAVRRSGTTPDPAALADQLPRATVPPASGDVVAAALRLVATLTRATIGGADGVSVSLPRHGQLVTVASTGDEAAALDEDQYATGEGPCVDAAREGRWFHVETVDGEERWPAFTSRARQRGMQSILSSPLLAGGRPIGSLNIYGRRAGAFTGREEELATVFATEAGGVLASAEPDAATEQLTERLREALGTRETVAMAQGVLMERDRLSAEDAFGALLRGSRATGEPLADRAAAIVASTHGHD